MLQYIGLVWDSQDSHQNEAARSLGDRIAVKAPTLRHAVDADGMRVWSNAPTRFHGLHKLADDGGVILGTLFKRGAKGEISEHCKGGLGQNPVRSIVKSAGRALVGTHWGRYVAFIYDASTKTTTVLRDPSGGVSCMYTTWCGVRIYFSSVGDCLCIGLTFTIDWNFVAGHITTWVMEGEQTMLKEVRQLHRGACNFLRQGLWDSAIYWSPADVAKSDEIEDEHDAARELWDAVLDSAMSWASFYEALILHVSGGLDSSILYALLSRSGRPVTGLTYYSQGNDSDEREYARCMARFLGRPLIEREIQWQVDLSEMLTCAPSATLYLNPLRVATSRLEAVLARELGATAVLSGGGGDQVFGSGAAAMAAVDFARKHGVGTRLLSVALHCARLERRSIYAVMLAAFRHGVRRRAFDPLPPRRNRLASDKARHIAQEEVGKHHSWSLYRDRLPPGKLAQVAAMAGRGDMTNPFAQEGDPDAVEPYMTQRVQEASARIPIYVMCSNGWDRDLERKTFAACLPKKIVERRNKGAVNENMHALLRHNIDFVRSVLCGGLLEQQGLLDGPALASFLDDDPQSEVAVMEVFHLLSAECRLRAW